MAHRSNVTNHTTTRISAGRTAQRNGGGSYRGNETFQGGAAFHGNAARKLDIRREMEEAPRRALSNTTRKNREKAGHMSLGYLTFLIAALFCAGLVLINYIQIQSDITTMAEEIARKESELNNLKLTNDETYNRITSSIDLEEIKRIAIGELGMTYAKEGQIETYSGAGTDYMREVAEE